MNAAILLILLVVAFSVLAGFVGLFLLACRLAGLPRPRLATAIGVVIATTFVWFVVEGIFLAALRSLYNAAGFPPWEVWIVGILAGLPVSLAAATVLHVALLRVTVSQAIQVWFIERLIRFSFVLAGVGVFTVLVLAKK